MDLKAPSLPAVQERSAMTSSTPEKGQPNPGGMLELPHGSAGSQAIKVSDIDSVMAREWSGEWLFDIVLKDGHSVTVAASDQNVEYLLRALGFFISSSESSLNCADPDR